MGADQQKASSLLRNPWLWAVFAGLVLIPAVRPLLRFEPAPPPVYAQLPDYSLIDSGERPFGSGELAGQVYVVNFIFTRCASICPLLTEAMARLERRYVSEGVERVRLVSITVDPAWDTPERLREYVSARGLPTDRWSFLTGPPERVRALVVEGFKTPLGTASQLPGQEQTNAENLADNLAEGDSLIDIAHTGKLVLVDQQGGIRGYYDSDESGLDEIFHRSRQVLRERRR